MSARGRIALINNFNLQSLDNSSALRQKVFSCMLCGACVAKCPLGIDSSQANYKVREALSKSSISRWLSQAITRLSFKSHYTQAVIFHALEVLQYVASRLPYGYFKHLAKYSIKVAFSPFKSAGIIHRSRHFRGRISLFVGCTINMLFPHIAKAFVRVANRVGYDVVVVKAEHCCGAPLLAEGLVDDFKEVAYKNLQLFKKLNVSAVVSLCPTCVHFIRDKYAQYVDDSITLATDAMSFLNDILKPHYSFSLPNTQYSSVILHESCHSKHYTKSVTSHLEVLEGFGFKNISTTKGCCGLAGGFALKHPDYSEAIFQKRVKEILPHKTLISTCPNCLIRFSSLPEGIVAKHTIEIVEELIVDVISQGKAFTNVS